MAQDSSLQHDQQRRAQRSERPAERSAGDSESMQFAGSSPTYSGSLLGDARLSGRGNQPVKVAMMRQAQLSYGNRAVQRWLAAQRSASDARETGETDEVPAHTSPSTPTSAQRQVKAQREEKLPAQMMGLAVNSAAVQRECESCGGKEEEQPGLVQRMAISAASMQVQRVPGILKKVGKVAEKIGIGMLKGVMGPFWKIVEYYQRKELQKQDPSVKRLFPELRKYASRALAAFSAGGAKGILKGVYNGFQMLYQGILKDLVAWSAWVSVITGILAVGFPALAAVSAVAGALGIAGGALLAVIDSFLSAFWEAKAWYYYSEAKQGVNVEKYLKIYSKYQQRRGEAVGSTVGAALGVVQLGAASAAGGTGFAEGIKQGSIPGVGDAQSLKAPKDWFKGSEFTPGNLAATDVYLYTGGGGLLDVPEYAKQGTSKGKERRPVDLPGEEQEQAQQQAPQIDLSKLPKPARSVKGVISMVLNPFSWFVEAFVKVAQGIKALWAARDKVAAFFKKVQKKLGKWFEKAKKPKKSAYTFSEEAPRSQPQSPRQSISVPDDMPYTFSEEAPGTQGAQGTQAPAQSPQPQSQERQEQEVDQSTVQDAVASASDITEDVKPEEVEGGLQAAVPVLTTTKENLGELGNKVE